MSDDDDHEYDINDPRTREHEAYKIAQENRGRATRRFKYGDDVDDKEDSPPEDEDLQSEDEDDDGSNDMLDEQLMNAREARGWAVDEANRRYEWNGQWTGGAHDGVEEQADARMEEVTRKGGWNDKIESLERAIAARDAEPGSPDDNGNESPELGEDEQDNFWEDRSERERGNRYAQEFNRVDEDDHEEEEIEGGEQSGSEDDDAVYDVYVDSDSD